MREYAQSDKYAASVLKKVENSRFKFLYKIFTEMGCSASVAKEKSKNVYMYYLGFFELHKYKGISPKLRKDAINEIITFFAI